MTGGAAGWRIGLATLVTVAVTVPAVAQVAPPPEGAPSTPALRRLFDGHGDVERVQTGFLGIDAVAWSPRDLLVLTDPPRQQILQWTSKDGLKIRREPSGGAAGVAFDQAGGLLVAERDTGHVTRIADDGSVAVVAETANGKPLGTPTDLAVDRDGSIYVTSYAGEEGREQYAQRSR